MPCVYCWSATNGVRKPQGSQLSLHFLRLCPHKRVVQGRKGVLVRRLLEKVRRLGLVALGLVSQGDSIQGVRILLVALAKLRERLIVMLLLQRNGPLKLVRQPNLTRVVLGSGAAQERPGMVFRPGQVPGLERGPPQVLVMVELGILLYLRGEIGCLL